MLVKDKVKTLDKACTRIGLHKVDTYPEGVVRGPGAVMAKEVVLVSASRTSFLISSRGKCLGPDSSNAVGEEG